MSGRVDATYLNLGSEPIAAGGVARTLEVRPDLLVDLDDDGRPLGIERIGGVVDLAAALDVVRALRADRHE